MNKSFDDRQPFMSRHQINNHKLLNNHHESDQSAKSPVNSTGVANHRTSGRGRGYSLVEILMAMVVLILLSAMIFQVFKGQSGSYRLSSGSQQMQESVRRLVMYLETDIKSAHTFQRLEDQALEISVFSGPPVLTNLADPATTANTTTVTYTYDQTTRKVTRTSGQRKQEFENIGPDLKFRALTFNTATGRMTTFDFDPATGNNTIIGVKVIVKATMDREINGRSPDLSLTTKFFSRNRSANFLYGPLRDQTGAATGRTISTSSDFDRELGYFSSVDADPSY
ncbi:MAG: hypothetical protein CVV64_13610 [Candidatus Wallbacteria bacterium HGW-Wallbacteria-1]|jgi:type II secretory pathway pseudopilin PulG|uniref:Prepilin-type N-terminal cleavage/methylation domain-containing protein n=1 Tax=Candidatus Wallbacteria bacterium HGW-Wallbacteria-1 TaxID=2013854 RepID=A0A2N1PMN3_9BACT|nr:MAG: hypothetical protein CVV64_13610 [Candidatus Wallbacteria bacterium HGW-Wallbacteria-1]